MHEPYEGELSDEISHRDKIRLGLGVTLALSAAVSALVEYPRPLGELAIVIGTFVAIVSIVTFVSWLYSWHEGKSSERGN